MLINDKKEKKNIYKSIDVIHGKTNYIIKNKLKNYNNHTFGVALNNICFFFLLLLSSIYQQVLLLYYSPKAIIKCLKSMDSY